MIALDTILQQRDINQKLIDNYQSLQHMGGV